MRRGTLEVPDGEIIRLNNDVTAIISGDYVFFRNRSAFQQLAGLLDALREQASVTFTTITAKTNNKTEAALLIFDAEQWITFPDYISKAVQLLQLTR